MNRKINVITKKFLICLIAFFAGIAITLHPCPSQGEETTATYDDVIAGFIINLLKFVEWPKAAFPTESSPIKIAVLNREGLYISMVDTVNIANNKKIIKQSIETIRATDTKDLEGSHAVFVGHENLEDTANIISHLAGKPILIIGDSKGFCKTGGMVNFYLNQGRIRFELNVNASKKAGLKISSELLKLSRIANEK